MPYVPQYGIQRDAANSKIAINYAGDPKLEVTSSGVTIPAGETLTISGTLSASGASLTAGTVPRASLETESVFIDCENALLAADGAALAASETAGDFFRQIGTNQLYIQGEAAQMETEASVGWFSFVLPENYVAGGTITLRAVVDVTGSGTLGTCTVDFEARLQTDATGAVGSDLVSTAATAVSATGAAKDFTVTPTGLVAGDKLVVKVTTSIEETMNTPIQAIITKLGVVVQVKG